MKEALNLPVNQASRQGAGANGARAMPKAYGIDFVDRGLPPEMHAAEVTGKESPEQVRRLFAAKGIYYSGDATWVQGAAGGYWHLHTSQIQARDTGTQLNLRADAIRSPAPAGKSRSTPALTHEAILARIHAKREENWVAAQHGMWNAAVDIAAPMWAPYFVTDALKFARPATTGNVLRDDELKESYEGGELVTNVVVTAASFLPVGELVEAAQLAASKAPRPAGGLGIVAQEFVSFDELWAAEANRDTGLNSRLIPPQELVLVEGGRANSPGKPTPRQRAAVQKTAAGNIGSGGPVDAAHLNPRSQSPPGPFRVRAQDPAINRAEGADIARANRWRRLWNALNPNGPQLYVR